MPLLAVGITARSSPYAGHGEDGVTYHILENLMRVVSPPVPRIHLCTTKTFAYNLELLRIQWLPWLVSLELFPIAGSVDPLYH